MAHELVHCFTGFLAGYPDLNTPLEVAAPGFENREKNCGESGRSWELRVLGGCASLSLVEEKGFKTRRALLWVERHGKGASAHPEAIRAIVERSTLAEAQPFVICLD